MDIEDLLNTSGFIEKDILNKIKLLRALANFYIENPTTDNAEDLVNQRTQILKAVKELESEFNRLLKNKAAPLSKENYPLEKVNNIEKDKDRISEFIKMTVPEESQKLWTPDDFTGSLLIFFVNGEIDSSSLIAKENDPLTNNDFDSVDDSFFPGNPGGRVRVVNSPEEVFTIVKSPVNSGFSIFYVLAEPKAVTIRIYNEMEQLIQQFEKECDQPGEYSVEWEGRNEYGNPLPNGTYYCQIQIGESVSELKAMQLSN